MSIILREFYSTVGNYHPIVRPLPIPLTTRPIPLSTLQTIYAPLLTTTPTLQIPDEVITYRLLTGLSPNTLFYLQRFLAIARQKFIANLTADAYYNPLAS